jgi:hypothetical protein
MILSWTSKVLAFPTFYISSLAGIGLIQLNGTAFPGKIVLWNCINF